MDDRLFELLDNLNIKDTELLLDKDINLQIDSFTRKRIEKSIKKKTGYYNKQITLKDKINDILGGTFMKRKIALALGACIILGSGGGAYAYAKTPVAYVSMDINPSVELGMNAFDKVVSVEAYNDDGEKILDNTDLKNYDISNALSTLLSHAISQGYIKEDGSSSIEITTSTDKDKIAIKLEQSLKDVADETLDNNDVKADVETENVALARRDEARKLGITPGKLNLIQKLQELDSTINVEDYKDKSVKEIQKKTIELRKDNKVDEITTTDDDVKSDEVITTDGDIKSNEVTEESGNSSSNKHNNGNGNNKKEQNGNNAIENNNTNTTIEKQNDNANSQGNNNSANSENKGNINSEHSKNSKSENNSSNSNSSKSENNGNENSNSQNKDKGKKN